MNEIIKNRNFLKEKDYLTVKETTELLGMHENTLYKMIKRGDLKTVKYLHKNYLSTKDIIEYASNIFGDDTINHWLEKG